MDSQKSIFRRLWILLVFINFATKHTKGTPLNAPNFVSPWYTITSDPKGHNRVDIDHGLQEMPVYVQVQVKSMDDPNKGFIFPAVGVIPRDDDNAEPYSGIVYLYNEVKVTVSAPTENNDYRGRTVYTENSQYWEGPNKQDVYRALVRVRAWKLASFPKPDFHSFGNSIGVGCASHTENRCFYEKEHGFGDFPSFTIVRTRLKAGVHEFNNFMSDAVGASHMVYDSIKYNNNGYVIYGFDRTKFRVWTDSTSYGALFISDGYNFHFDSNEGELEIIAWKEASLQQDYEHQAQLGAIPGSYFEMETSFELQTRPSTDNIIGVVWVEAHDGSNKGFRFPGSGSMSYSASQTASPCCYGGLTFAYTNSTLRLWKPGNTAFGKLICVANIFGGGKFSQASDNGTAVMNIWTVSDLGQECINSTDCTVDHTECINQTCQCNGGYFEHLSRCFKELVCSDAVPSLPELPRRQRNYIVENDIQSERFVDDSYLRESWYTTETTEGQYLMPDSNTTVVSGSCGTLNPAVIKGIHPATSELTEDAIELNVTVLKESDTIFNIKVRKCGQSIQYRLNPIIAQSFAFCFDSPMIQGLQDFDDAPKDVSVGDLHVNVELQFYFKDNRYNAPMLVFGCESDQIENLPDGLLYTTYWFVDGNLLDVFGPSSHITSLTELTLLHHNVPLGFNVHCGVQMSTSETGYKTSLVQSNPFFRWYQDPNRCENSLTSVASTIKCGIAMQTVMNASLWESQIYEFNITTVDKTYDDKYFFRLHFITDTYGHEIWRAYQPEDVTVIVTNNEDSKHKLCYSHVDPHMMTADKHPYEHQVAGEFILYRNFVYGIEVQMKTTLCNRGRAYCACAVAIRAGGDVYLINLCGNSKSIGYTSCSDNGIIAVNKENDRKYRVTTPIGTSIDIKIRPHPGYPNLMNIDIYMAPKDFQATEGLCGYYDNNKTNDLRRRESDDFYRITTSSGRYYHKEFSNEWRIQSNEPNYLGLSIDPVPGWTHHLFCSCNKTGGRVPSAVCSPALLYNCSRDENEEQSECNVEINENRNKREIKRRSVLANREIEKRGAEREKRDIQTQEANAICRNVILGHPTISNFKDRLIGIDLEHVIQECSFDIVTEGDESWAQVYPDTLIEIIKTYNKKEPKYVAEHPDEILRFKEMSCPRNCSRLGKCNENGTCTCQNGHNGSDCSIDLSAHLRIDDIYGDGFCDLNDQSTCDCFSVQTIDLVDGFFCNITTRKVLVNGSEVYDQSVVPGSYKDIFNGNCCVAGLKGRSKRSTEDDNSFATYYNISISNTDHTFGDPRTMIVYDSVCQDISMASEPTIELKAHTCFIDGRCVHENDTAVRDKCLGCFPASSLFTWTNNCKEESVNLELIAICSGTALALLIVLVIMVFVRCICRPRKEVSDVAMFNSIARPTVVHKHIRSGGFEFGVHKQ